MSGTKFTISTELPETHDAAAYEKLKFIGVSEATNSQLFARVSDLEAINSEMYAIINKMVSMMNSGDESESGSEWHVEAECILAKARGES